MKDFKDLEKDLTSREEEEERIRDYIDEYTDLEDYEKDDLVKNLDVKTIAAFEEAMDKVATEYDREKSKEEVLRNFVSEMNRQEKLVSLSTLVNGGYEDLDLDRETIVSLLENRQDYEDLKDIEIIERDKDSYIYDSSLFTRQYALTAVILEEGNILEAISERTRKDCKIYPRPVQVTALKLPPYAYTDEEISAALDKMKTMDEYSDIGTVSASNGGVCIYSSEFMSEKYARALCEDIEVERKKYQ